MRRMTDYLFIDRADQLADFCRESSDCDWLGVDTEFLREKTYYPKLCLIQLANEHNVACVDPLAIEDLSPLADLLADPDSVKVLHAARQDIEVLLYSLDVAPCPLFDTQLAAGFLGLADQIGYARLTASVTGVELEKAHTRTDWSHRPLSPGALAYAADDVRYLGTLYRSLGQQLERADRSAWMDAESALLIDPSRYTADPEQAFSRVRGQSRIEDSRTRGAMQALASWRERRAMKKNRPRRWILKDEALIELAERAPRSPDELAGIAGLGGLLKGGRGRELVETIAAGLDRPLPQPPGTTLTREQRGLVRELGNTVRERAADIGISPSLLANRKQLERLVRGERDLPVLAGWRRRVTGERLLDQATQPTAPTVQESAD